jgi:outer membrane protein, multidrug efflux system
VKRISLLTAAFSFLLLVGCTVGPSYKRPQVQVPKEWTVHQARGTSTKALETGEWWSSFQDPKLSSLIERAVDRNLDLKLALERVQEARAARGTARSAYFPSIDANVSATRVRGGINQGVIRAVPSSADHNARANLISPFETSVFQGNLSAAWSSMFSGESVGVCRQPRQT